MKKPRKIISFNLNGLNILIEIEINKRLHFTVPSINFVIDDGKKIIKDSVFDEDHTKYFFYIGNNDVLTKLSRDPNIEDINKYKNELIIDKSINSYVYEKINKLLNDNFSAIKDSYIIEIVNKVVRIIKGLHYPLYLLFFSWLLITTKCSCYKKRST